MLRTSESLAFKSQWGMKDPITFSVNTGFGVECVNQSAETPLCFFNSNLPGDVYAINITTLQAKHRMIHSLHSSTIPRRLRLHSKKSDKTFCFLKPGWSLRDKI